MAMSSPQDFRIDQETVSERQDGGRDGEEQQWHYLKIDSKFASYARPELDRSKIRGTVEYPLALIFIITLWINYLDTDLYFNINF